MSALLSQAAGQGNSFLAPGYEDAAVQAFPHTPKPAASVVFTRE